MRRNGPDYARWGPHSARTPASEAGPVRPGGSRRAPSNRAVIVWKSGRRLRAPCYEAPPFGNAPSSPASRARPARLGAERPTQAFSPEASGTVQRDSRDTADSGSAAAHRTGWSPRRGAEAGVHALENRRAHVECSDRPTKRGRPRAGYVGRHARAGPKRTSNSAALSRGGRPTGSSVIRRSTHSARRPVSGCARTAGRVARGAVFRSKAPVRTCVK